MAVMNRQAGGLSFGAMDQREGGLSEDGTVERWSFLGVIFLSSTTFSSSSLHFLSSISS